MSEPIPESIPTSTNRISKRPIKKARTANPAIAAQAGALSQLFKNPEREIAIPESCSASSKQPNSLPPEIVANVQGSSAGAGSGEFHVYKASRRREYERLRLMDEEVKKEKEQEEFERTKREREARDEEKTRKNRERRNKKKGKRAGAVKGKDEEGKSKWANGGVKLPGTEGGDDGDAAMNATDEAQTTEVGVIIHDDD